MPTDGKRRIKRLFVRDIRRSDVGLGNSIVTMLAGERTLAPELRSVTSARPVGTFTPARSWPVATDPLKRLFDIFASAFALLVFLPLLVMVMVLIKLESPGPAIFRQRRTGYRGRVFTIYKFRTMTVTEDSGQIRQATKGDARVTAMGALLRKLSIDELPQLVNVLKGDMSIVGPRPHALAHDEYYGALIPTYAARFRARPGLTGYAQVNGFRGEINDTRGMSDRVAADNSYIDEWSKSLDLAILARTVPLIFRDPRAY